MGFSVIELVVVVVILGIVSSIAVRRVGAMGERAKIAQAQTTVRQVLSMINEYHALHGGFPEDVPAAWFAKGELPVNPFAAVEPRVQVVDKTRNHPNNTFYNGSNAPYWYNRPRGLFRMRVAPRWGADVYTAVNVLR